MRHMLPLLLLAACGSTAPRSPVVTAAAPADAPQVAPAPPPPPCPGLAVLTVTPDAVEVAVGSGAVQSIPDRDGAVDGAAVRAAIEAGTDEAHDECAHFADVGARGEVRYGDLVAAMDAANAAGHQGVGILPSHEDLFPAPPVPQAPRGVSPGPDEVERLMGSLSDLTQAPQVVVDAITIRLRLSTPGREAELVVDDVAPLGDAEALLRMYELLRAEHAATTPSPAVALVQAEHATPAALVTAAIAALYAAGYDMVMFATPDAGTSPLP